jgi:hypothetical protein
MLDSLSHCVRDLVQRPKQTTNMFFCIVLYYSLRCFGICLLSVCLSVCVKHIFVFTFVFSCRHWVILQTFLYHFTHSSFIHSFIVSV